MNEYTDSQPKDTDRLPRETRPVPPQGDSAASDDGLAPTIAIPRVPNDDRSQTPPPQRPGYVPPQPPAGEQKPPRRWDILLVKIGFGAVFSAVMLFFLAVAASVVGYAAIASQLPSPTALRERQTAFVSSKIFAQNNKLLYEIIDPHGGRRTYVPFDDISTHLINATVATEDRNFWRHPGFDPFAIARAVYYALTEREIVSGASTITQQLARNVILDPEERVERTVKRKIKEIVLAAELRRTYSKKEVLETYLNELYYGNQSYGIQAAAETYFGVDAADLTIAQASFLAGLPQLPATYDPLRGGREQALSRQEDVLALMVEDGYISQAQADQAAAEMRAYEFAPPEVNDVYQMRAAPHFVTYVRQIVEGLYGPEALYRGTGLRIYTTLDPELQRKAEQAVREGVAALVERNATNGALVAIEPETGYIRAMVGSADFHNEEIDGQVNVALRCRQPGSSIKPLTYVAAFERGWTPATVLWDVRTEFPDGANPPYVPTNYDEKYHGPMSVREALANSYNVPAVEGLQFVGVDGLLEIASRLGVRSLAHPERHCPDYPYDQPPPYGLALTLGGGEVKLLEMTGAFATFANGGLLMEPTPILRIEDSRGNVLVNNARPTGERAISREHAYLITDILADTEARCDAFRCPSVLELNRPVAAKTGTTNDYRDAWTVGYTPHLATGVWVGNSDNSEMINLPGSAGAGPIWHKFMEAAHEGIPTQEFERPPGVIEREICADSGAQPTEYCPRRKKEVFAEDNPPPDESHDWYQMIEIDAFTGLRANEYCSTHTVERLMLDITDKRGREWVQAHPERFGNLPLAPLDYCTESTGRPEVFITQPRSGSVVQGIVRVIGTVQLPNFDHYEAQYGLGGDPQGWKWISGPHLAPVRDGVLFEWDTTHLSPGSYTLRVTAFDHEQHPVEARVQVRIAQPTATPTLTPSPTSEATVTPLPTATATTAITPTITPMATATAAPTLPATETSPPSTLTPSPEPTQGAEEVPTSTPSSTPENTD